MVELTTQLLILANILWLPLYRINIFGLSTLPSKTIAIPYTCGLSECKSRSSRGSHEIGGRPPVGCAPCLVGPSGGHRRTSSSYIILRTPKTSREPTKHNFHRRNLLYPRDPILEPSSVLRRRGNRPRRASTSTSLPLR